MHVFFEFGIALRIPGEVFRGRHPLGLAAHGEPLQPHAVETEVELVRLAHADDVVVLLPSQQDLDGVLRVERKVISNQRAALRAERQIVAQALVLHERFGNLERIDDRYARGIADGEPAERARGRQVIFEQRRRDRQYARDVVEAFLIRFVRRQQRTSIDLETQQIADGVRVLVAVQTVNRNPARMRFRRRRRVQVTFQRRRGRIVGHAVRTRPPGRRHLAGAKLRDDLFPLLRVVSNALHVQAVDLEGCRFQSRVVTRDAVPVEKVGRVD